MGGMVRKSRSFASFANMDLADFPPMVRDDSLIFTLVVKGKDVFPNTAGIEATSSPVHPSRPALEPAIEFICSNRAPSTLVVDLVGRQNMSQEVDLARQKPVPDTIPKVTKALEGSFCKISGLLLVMTKLVRRWPSSWSNPSVAGLSTVAWSVFPFVNSVSCFTLLLGKN